MSLINCIKKAGKSISQKDSQRIMSKYEELSQKGVDDIEAQAMAVRDLEDAIDFEIKDILKKAGIEPQSNIAEGAPIEVDGKMVDSNQYMSELDKELAGIDEIARCLVK